MNVTKVGRNIDMYLNTTDIQKRQETKSYILLHRRWPLGATGFFGWTFLYFYMVLLLWSFRPKALLISAEYLQRVRSLTSLRYKSMTWATSPWSNEFMVVVWNLWLMNNSFRSKALILSILLMLMVCVCVFTETNKRVSIEKLYKKRITKEVEGRKNS
jgi:hypothetical protein